MILLYIAMWIAAIVIVFRLVVFSIGMSVILVSGNPFPFGYKYRSLPDRIPGVFIIELVRFCVMLFVLYGLF